MSVTINGTTGIAGVDGSAGTPALQGTDTNTGVFFGADTVTIATGGTERGTFDSSGNFKFNSGYGSAAVGYGCRAWVNFNGTTASPSTIRGSGNVTSVTKNATGDYTVNFTTALVDANYSVTGACSFPGGSQPMAIRLVGSTTTTQRLELNDTYNRVPRDTDTICIGVFR